MMSARVLMLFIMPHQHMASLHPKCLALCAGSCAKHSRSSSRTCKQKQVEAYTEGQCGRQQWQCTLRVTALVSCCLAPNARTVVHHLSPALIALTFTANLPFKFALPLQVQQADDLIDAEFPAHVRIGSHICNSSSAAVSDWPGMQVSSTSDVEPATSSDHGVTLSADEPTPSPRKGVQLDFVLQSQCVLIGVLIHVVPVIWKPAHSPHVPLAFIVCCWVPHLL